MDKKRVCIVTTTINEPTEATLAYCKIAYNSFNIKNMYDYYFTFLIVGDKNTPHSLYKELEEKYRGSVFYLTPEYQENYYKTISDEIGWKSIQRRNIGFLYAFKHRYDIVATVDDDNIPYSNWGKKIYVGETIEVNTYDTYDTGVFDPLSVTEYNHLWHRGYPLDYVPKEGYNYHKNNFQYSGKKYVKCRVQANLWDGDPDIDAICRLTYKPIVKFKNFKPYSSKYSFYNDNSFSTLSPFNSQNTFLDINCIPYYAVLPHCGRMDDIWGGYILQKHFDYNERVVYDKATVYQDRNIQDLVTNLENEIIGYRKTKELINSLNFGKNDSFKEILPEKTQRFYDLWLNQF